ncbi:hypothetical protein, partial [Pseudomonas sp. CGJS7]|uniref:hypothetical protein n=1 Tax=Pseudomonas sp. CGJS7 TaxID=3109348 RepID=UPI003009C5A6
MNVNTCSRTSCCFPFRRPTSFSEASVSPGRASYSIVSNRQPPVETAVFRAPINRANRRSGRASYSMFPTRQPPVRNRRFLRPVNHLSGQRAAHLTASFSSVNTGENR